MLIDFRMHFSCRIIVGIKTGNHLFDKFKISVYLELKPMTFVFALGWKSAVGAVQYG